MSSCSSSKQLGCCLNTLLFKLAGGFKHFLDFSLLGQMIPFDFHIFQMFGKKPPTTGSTPICFFSGTLRTYDLRYTILFKSFALPPGKTNMEPENEPLEEEIPIINHHFQVPC